MKPVVEHHRFTVDEFYRMQEAGIWTEDSRVELIEGEIFHMPPIGSQHAGTVDQISHLFHRLLAGRAIIRVQSPVRIDEYTEPQPDITLLKPRPDFYRTSHPTPPDVWLVVEVAETSADYDREVKMPVYGRAGIPEAWVVDLVQGWVEVYTMPWEAGYRQKRIYHREERIQLQVFPDVAVEASALL